MSKEGLKHDQGKARWDLLPHGVVGKVVDVLTFGAVKYTDNSWQNVDDGKRRYYAASLRHLTAWWEGERYDDESGIHHLAHAACNLFFLMWLDERQEGCCKVTTVNAGCSKPLTQQEMWDKQDKAIEKMQAGRVWKEPIISVFHKD